MGSKKAAGKVPIYAVLGLVALANVGCDSRSGPVRQLSTGAAHACLDMDNSTFKEQCAGHFAQYVGKVSDSRFDGYEIIVPFNKPVIVITDQAADKGTIVQIRGEIVDGNPLTVEASTTEVLSLPSKTVRTPTVSPEVQIARNREMGAKALDEWDAAIRQNNTDIKAALAAKAVTHSVSNSGDLLVDVYGMPDGRFIACKTVVGSVGAPIVSCDGEP